jgi:hypothetical protein
MQAGEIDDLVSPSFSESRISVILEFPVLERSVIGKGAAFGFRRHPSILQPPREDLHAFFTPRENLSHFRFRMKYRFLLTFVESVFHPYISGGLGSTKCPKL